MRKFKINCREVYNTSEKYLEIKNELSDIQKELKNIGEEITEAWKGVDSHNFKVNFGLHVDSFERVIYFMEFHHELLKDNSKSHSNVDKEFDERMKRSDKYE